MSEQYPTICELLNANGFLLLNEDKRYDSICSLGGDWEDLIKLIHEKNAFVTKLIDGKTTLISKEVLHALLSIESDRYVLTELEERIIDFLKEHHAVNSKALQAYLNISSKDLNKNLKNLHNRLFVAVVGEDKRLNRSWGTYLYGLMELNNKEDYHTDPYTVLRTAFQKTMSMKKLSNLTGRKIE